MLWKKVLRKIWSVLENTDQFGDVLDNLFFSYLWPYMLLYSLLFEVRSCSSRSTLHVGVSGNEL